MIKALVFILLLIMPLSKENHLEVVQNNIAIGDELVLGKPSTRGYSHVRFPKINFIMKRGGVVNFKKLQGDKVKVIHVEKADNGSTQITLQRTDGKKFFNRIATIKADFEKALEKKEVLLLP